MWCPRRCATCSGSGLRLRCTTPQASDTILGQGWASRGHNAGTISPADRGVGFLLAEDGLPVKLRTFYLDDEHITSARRSRPRDGREELSGRRERRCEDDGRADATAAGVRERIWRCRARSAGVRVRSLAAAAVALARFQLPAGARGLRGDRRRRAAGLVSGAVPRGGVRSTAPTSPRCCTTVRLTTRRPCAEPSAARSKWSRCTR